MIEMWSKTTDMRLCDVCNRNITEKNGQKYLQSQKQFDLLGQLENALQPFFINFSTKAYEKHLPSDKHLLKTGQRSGCDKYQIFHDRIHRHDFQEVKCGICKT